ncbi:hypothetical protein GN956_G24321 [Arapaima gigas]
MQSCSLCHHVDQSNREAKILSYDSKELLPSLTPYCGDFTQCTCITSPADPGFSCLGVAPILKEADLTQRGSKWIIFTTLKGKCATD